MALWGLGLGTAIDCKSSESKSPSVMANPNPDWNKPTANKYFGINKNYEYTLDIKLYQGIY
jgi:hypothetical protein